MNRIDGMIKAGRRKGFQRRKDGQKPEVLNAENAEGAEEQTRPGVTADFTDSRDSGEN